MEMNKTNAKIYKIYGKEGHRQKESFNESHIYRSFNKNEICITYNSDMTNTNEYSILAIIKEKSCKHSFETILFSQLSDGIYENCNTGNIEEITIEDLELILFSAVKERMKA